MPDRFGQACALTILSPIIGGHSDGFVHATGIRTALARLPQGARSPLAAIPTLHVGRFVVLDDLRNQGVPAKEDHLRSRYLVFVADFDGELPAFLAALATRARELVNALWQHCVGFPGTHDLAAFQQYMARCRVPTTFPFGAYPGTPLRDVLRALDSQRRLIAFLRDHQGAPAADLQRAFLAFAETLQAAAPPAPGTV
jgi:hypothetical protein